MLPGRLVHLMALAWDSGMKPAAEVTLTRQHREAAGGIGMEQGREVWGQPQYGGMNWRESSQAARYPLLNKVGSAIHDQRLWLARPFACVSDAASLGIPNFDFIRA